MRIVGDNISPRPAPAGARALLALFAEAHEGIHDTPKASTFVVVPRYPSL
jgi:hypothetical protein